METKLYRIVAAVALAMLLSKQCWAEGEKVKPTELPRPVAAALHERFKSAEIVSAEKEIEEGKTIYDVELKYEGRKFETDIQADGQMIEVEKQIVEDRLPKELVEGINAANSHPKIIEVMQVCKVHGKEEMPHHFEVTIAAGDGKNKELLFTIDGKPMEDEGAPEASGEAAEEEVKSEDLPSAIKAVVESRFPKSTISSAEKGKEEGQTIFELSIKHDKHDIDVTLSPEGKILSLEKAISAAEMPAAMSDALKSKYPKATLKLAEEVWEGDKLTGFEATVITIDKKTVEVMFDAQGKVVEAKTEG